MTDQVDDEARLEAADHAATADELGVLRDQVAVKLRQLGDGGVRSHCVYFSKASWAGLLDRLPLAVVERGSISRGDVFDIADRARPGGDLDASDLFTASFLWGTGTTGYGASRYREIKEIAGDGLEASLRQALDQAYSTGPVPDPVAGYAELYGGYNYRQRAKAGEGDTSRIHKFGPAFFTKFLYFSTPGALILDNVLANAVKRRSGLEHLVTRRGHSKEWTPYRYATYMHWMRMTAESLGVEPDVLEVTLFAPPAHDFDEGVNAD
jgi:hypothetical protein